MGFFWFLFKLFRVFSVFRCFRNTRESHQPSYISLQTSDFSPHIVVTLTKPRRITKDSSFVGCLWMGTTVPGSTAFSIRWHLSSSDWLKPYAEITPNKADYKASISSSPVGSYGPSLTSIMTVPDSRARTVCHWPMGMFRATTGPPGLNSMRSVQIRSNSS